MSNIFGGISDDFGGIHSLPEGYGEAPAGGVEPALAGAGPASYGDYGDYGGRKERKEKRKKLAAACAEDPETEGCSDEEKEKFWENWRLFGGEGVVKRGEVDPKKAKARGKFVGAVGGEVLPDLMAMISGDVKVRKGKGKGKGKGKDTGQQSADSQNWLLWGGLGLGALVVVGGLVYALSGDDDDE